MSTVSVYASERGNGARHVSIVAFEKDFSYGPDGIQTTTPGGSHVMYEPSPEGFIQHGRQPTIEVIGETTRTRKSFYDHLDRIQNEYTRSKYDAQRHNCDRFANECVSFLTDNSTPDLVNFLAESIMPELLKGLMNPGSDVVSRPSTVPATNDKTRSSDVHYISDEIEFVQLLQSNKAVVAFFTLEWCPPSRQIEPLFKELAKAKARKDAAFIKVNIEEGEWGIPAAPTFVFFLNGEKVDELTGNLPDQLRARVEYLFFEAFPPHLNSGLPLSAFGAISTEPILYSTSPSFDQMAEKLRSYIGASHAPDRELIIEDVDRLLGSFKAILENPGATETHFASTQLSLMTLTERLLDILPNGQVFPLIDLSRLAILNNAFASQLVARSLDHLDQRSHLEKILDYVYRLHAPGAADVHRYLLLVALRLFANLFKHPQLASILLSTSLGMNQTVSNRRRITFLLSTSLLHAEPSARIAASSLLFNITAFVHRSRKQHHNCQGGDEYVWDAMDAEWETEMIPVVAEALKNESNTDDVVYRLLASLAMMVHESPYYSAKIEPVFKHRKVKVILAPISEGKRAAPAGAKSKDPKVLEKIQAVASDLIAMLDSERALIRPT